jgi:hypothetical protein
MDYKKYRGIQNIGELRKELAKDLTKQNYNPEARPGDVGWSLSEMVGREDREATLAACLVHGKNERGNPLPAGQGIVSKKRDVKLQVMTRQGCTTDEEGNPIVTNPTERRFVSPDEKPVPGDIIMVKTRPLEFCPDTERPMDRVATRNDRQRRGKSLWEEEAYEVDEDLCVTLPISHAYELLSKNGYRMVGPEFQKYNSNLRTLDKDGVKMVDPRRRVTNWWYKEVAEDFKQDKPKKKRVKKADPPPVPGADLAFPHDME